jgi:hypothetical protein
LAHICRRCATTLHGSDFISREIDKWEEHYARFKQTEGESHRCGDGPGQPTAFDFVETIAALAALQARYSGRKAA